MRRIALAALTVAFIALGVASCRDAVAPGDTSPAAMSGPQLAMSAAGRITICHAAGNASDPKYVQLTVAERAAAAHLTERGTTAAGHELDYAVTDRAPCPPPSTPGLVNVCKVGTAGVPAGTPFSFTVNGTPLIVATGQCVTLRFRVGTHVDVAEIASANTSLTGLTLVPATAGTTDQQTGTASLIAGVGNTTLTYTNSSTTNGALVICKVAGPGITAGRSFDFHVENAPGPTVAAGSCSDPISVVASTISLGESSSGPDFDVASIAVDPTANRVTGGITGVVVKILVGQTTTVSFTNESTYGSLVICKVAGAGVGADMEFTFDLRRGAVDVPDPITLKPGACSTPRSFIEGDITINEREPVGFAVTSIVVVPSGNVQVLHDNTAIVKIVRGTTTMVTYTNSATPP